MRAIPKTTPYPVEVPEPILPVPAPLPPRKRAWGKLLVLAILLGAVIWGAYQLWLKPRQTTTSPVVAVPTTKVTAGPLEQVVRLSGVTSSRKYVNVTAPQLRGPESRDELVLLFLIQSGKRVKKGDLLAQIDGEAAQNHIDDVQATVQTSEADIKKRKAEQAIDWENLQQTLKVAKADLDKVRLDASTAEVRTVIDQELLKLAVEEAEARYEQLQADIAYKQAAHKAELRILEITRERHVSHRDRHIHDLEKFTIRSPMDGLAVIQPIFRGGEFSLIQQGDQVRPGQLILKVMDTDNMQVEANVNQAESSQFRIGQQARIGLDAFPGLQFKAKVYSIGALAKGGWRENYYIRNIPVSIVVDGSDPRLIPDLSAHVEVVTERVENATRIPLAAVHREGSKQVVYVKKGATYEKREVELGFRNETQAAVVAGVATGEEVALRVPTT